MLLLLFFFLTSGKRIGSFEKGVNSRMSFCVLDLGPQLFVISLCFLENSGRTGTGMGTQFVEWLSAMHA